MLSQKTKWCEAVYARWGLLFEAVCADLKHLAVHLKPVSKKKAPILEKLASEFERPNCFNFGPDIAIRQQFKI